MGLNLIVLKNQDEASSDRKAADESKSKSN